MMQNRITYLVEKHLAQEATPAEREEFSRIVQNAAADSSLREALAAAWLQFSTEDQLPQQQADAMFNAIISDAAGLHDEPAKLVTMKVWVRVAAAASIIIMLAAGAWWYFNYNYKKPADKINSTPVAADIKPPSSVNAILTLANGQQIELNKTGNGSIAQQGNANVVKQEDGQIVYNNASANASTGHAPLAYNTLTVPRGSKVVSIVLSDGTKVWLNSASSLRYPASFTGNERNVEMTGEVYFEVAKIHAKPSPFIVHIRPSAGRADEGRVDVLGTHFNINAYADEPVIKTTLLEGKVKVSSMINGDSAMLKPGQQAVFGNAAKSSQILVQATPDVEEVMAWKNGRFEFSGNTIEPIMNQVARWYDVDIEYKGAKPADNFMGGTSRQANVSELLKILEQTKAIHFQVEGRKIIVSKP